MKIWKTSRRNISLEKPLIMGILNVTPDSFSDGGRFFAIDNALRQAEKMIDEGADILDVGGESTRPNSERVSADKEIRRVVPVIEAVANRFDVPISIDTSKSAVAEKAVQAGAEIINDISGLRFDEKTAEIAAKEQTGLILMHLAGEFETMHKQNPVSDVLTEVAKGFRFSVEKAKDFGIDKSRIVLDVGIGFSKSFEQNLELIAKIGDLKKEFSKFAFLVGASRKSFIGKILGDASVEKRLYGSLSAHAVAFWNGADILRVHDVRETVESLKIVKAIKDRL